MEKTDTKGEGLTELDVSGELVIEAALGKNPEAIRPPIDVYRVGDNDVDGCSEPVEQRRRRNVRRVSSARAHDLGQVRTGVERRDDRDVPACGALGESGRGRGRYASDPREGALGGGNSARPRTPRASVGSLPRCGG